MNDGCTRIRLPRFLFQNYPQGASRQSLRIKHHSAVPNPFSAVPKITAQSHRPVISVHAADQGLRRRCESGRLNHGLHRRAQAP